MAILPEHTSITIIHNWHVDNGYETVEECFNDNGGFKPEEWDSQIAFQKACATNELWAMHWVPEKDKPQNNLFAPTFKDLMKLMLMASKDKLVDYE